MQKFVRMFAIAGACVIAVVFLAVVVIAGVTVSNAKAAEQKNAIAAATQQNVYNLLDSNGSRIAYDFLVEDNWENLSDQLNLHFGRKLNYGALSGITLFTAGSTESVVILYTKNDGKVRGIGIQDIKGSYIDLAEFDPIEGNLISVNLGENRPTLQLTPTGTIYLSQTIGLLVNGTPQ